MGLAAAGGAVGGAIGGWTGGAVGGAIGGPGGAALGRLIGTRAGSTVGSAIEDNCECLSGYIRLYRVVGTSEYRSISATQQYSILQNGFGQKQFWFRMSDAWWFAGQEVKMDPLAGQESRYIVSSRICSDNLRKGIRLSDVGHDFVSFDATGLPSVNRDAAATGGIRNVAGIPPVK